MRTVKTYNQFLNEGSSIDDMNAFTSDVYDKGDPSDIWNDVENGHTYIAIETEGMNKKAERQLKADVDKIATEHGYTYAKDYKAAQKLGIGNAYADDAILVYVGK